MAEHAPATGGGEPQYTRTHTPRQRPAAIIILKNKWYITVIAIHYGAASRSPSRHADSSVGGGKNNK
ncbi:unnamed protein product, partial [Brenthis ino]